MTFGRTEGTAFIDAGVVIVIAVLVLMSHVVHEVIMTLLIVELELFERDDLFELVLNSLHVELVSRKVQRALVHVNQL